MSLASWLDYMDANELRARTRQFALDVIDLCLLLTADDLEQLVRKQLLRAGTGVASNYRAATRARSKREFCSRLAVVVEEADESEFWTDILQAKRRGPAALVATLNDEAAQLRAIFASSRTTTLSNLRTKRPPRRV